MGGCRGTIDIAVVKQSSVGKPKQNSERSASTVPIHLAKAYSRGFISHYVGEDNSIYY